MPTGYTAGILDGTVKDFNEFAKKCSRAFMIHLRDEPFDSEYKKREPSDYHSKNLKEAEVNYPPTPIGDRWASGFTGCALLLTSDFSSTFVMASSSPYIFNPSFRILILAFKSRSNL